MKSNGLTVKNMSTICTPKKEGYVACDEKKSPEEKDKRKKGSVERLLAQTTIISTVTVKLYRGSHDGELAGSMGPPPFGMEESKSAVDEGVIYQA
ncbi:hypothetical protein EJB05_23046, partial [Eragrostis curvula]